MNETAAYLSLRDTVPSHPLRGTGRFNIIPNDSVKIRKRSGAIRVVKRWLPVILWMTGIFYFSSRTDPLDFLPSSKQGAYWGMAAHFAEYAGLTILLHRALSRSRTSLHPFAPALIALAYAILDELHHELVPGRRFELGDIGLDVTGIVVALGTIWGRNRTNRHSQGHN